MKFPDCWKNRELIRHAEIMDILQDCLEVADHPIPKHTVGQLYVVGGISEAASEILQVLILRTVATEEKKAKAEEKAKKS